MKLPTDLVLGRPRVALAPSRLLTGEVTTPYGTLPGDEAVEAAWVAEAGAKECPPWLILGRRDAPSGTIWRLAWCPTAGTLPDRSEIVLPEAAWALERLNEIQGPENWHLRSMESPSGFWIGLWQGNRCEHLQAPWRERQDALDLECAVAAKHDVAHPQEYLADWAAPTPEQLAVLSDSSPESDLLEVSESVRRRERRANATAICRTSLVLIFLAAISGAFGVFQFWQAHQRGKQESRLESVKNLVDHSANLEASRATVLDTLRSFGDALRRSQAADLVVAGIASMVPPGSRLQALSLEETPKGWRLRTEARLPDWNAIQPFTQSLRKVVGVTKVSVANQARQADVVSVVLEIEGVWP